jgi:hypothetical protein
MISITETAMEAINESVKERGDAPCVRIYIAGYG